MVSEDNLLFAAADFTNLCADICFFVLLLGFSCTLKADNPLHGSSLIEYAHLEQWLDFATTEIDQGIARWLRKLQSALKRALSTLEFPHVERYFWTMVNQPNFRKVLGEVKQTESVYPIQSQKKPAEPKGAAKPKEANKEVKREAPEEPAKPKVEAVAEDDEGAPKQKTKPKNPVDLLPPSKMILDEWKRLYSNTKSNFCEVAIGGFWDLYDPEGWSLWFCDYKYNDENTVSFVTLNKHLLNMEAQRLGMGPHRRHMGAELYRAASLGDNFQELKSINSIKKAGEVYSSEEARS
ncbi:hypothetical protein J5N97_026429 [Dioscorea zingiberensis]|uniref:EF-1-gamma C-terminal domain-containing protein n=1 Tax=Dioscorea zingiberensis TaxID=325984 RepID=A0A9D5C2B7_9LILI|nr:hypothetical protein J5N97_026429 [Dioscorea zingiberensis]